MTDTAPDDRPDQQPPTPDPALAGQGLSATGRTADQFEPGEPGPGTTYGSPSGTGGEDRETVAGSAPDGADGAEQTEE